MVFRASSSRSSRVARTGRRPTNSGIRPNFSRSSGSTSRKISPVRRSSGELDRGAEADGRALAAAGDDPLEAREGAAADEQDVRGVDLQELLLRVLAAALGRHGGDGAFHDLQERLLHALARDVAGDRGVVRLAGDLVDLVDIDDAALRPLDIVVGGLEQLEDDVLHVLADIAGLGQGRGVRHGERHVQDPGQGLGEQGLARAGGADQQDVGLGQFDVVVLRRVGQALVMVVDRHREHLLGVLLADHVIVQNAADFLRGRNPVAGLHERRFRLLADDVHAQLDAFIADENRRASDQLANLMLALAAEGAVQRALGVVAASLGHYHISNPCRDGPCRPSTSSKFMSDGANERFRR